VDQAMKTNHGTKIALAALAFLLIAAASPFVSVTVDSITGALRGSSTNLFSANSNRLNSAVNLSSRVAKGGDTMTGTLAVPAITLNGTNLADLIGAGGGGGADKLPLAGGTLTGPLVGTSAAFTNGVNTVTAARTENTFDLPVDPSRSRRRQRSRMGLPIRHEVQRFPRHKYGMGDDKHPLP